VGSATPSSNNNTGTLRSNNGTLRSNNGTLRSNNGTLRSNSGNNGTLLSSASSSWYSTIDGVAGPPSSYHTYVNLPRFRRQQQPIIIGDAGEGGLLVKNDDIEVKKYMEAAGGSDSQARRPGDEMTAVEMDQQNDEPLGECNPLPPYCGHTV
jgi:hypothetical protein